MAALLHGVPSRYGVNEGGAYMAVQERLEESCGRWYFSRREIEEDSPSRRDGIDLKKETYLRKSYCTYLQDLGMRLKVPQVTIATAIIFCHRFFHRQSHVKNDRTTVATVCMFLAGKVEETPRPLKDVILVSYEVIHKKDGAAAIQRIKQKDVYEQQKELILIAERVVLTTLAFDMNVLHPYKPLVEAIKKFKVAQNALAQVAWNFVNDGLRTSICLQFKPHHIAAGAIFLAAKFLKVNLPSEGEKVWWQEFDVTPRQLEEVSNQMLELYEQNKVPASQAIEAEGSAGGAQRPPMKVPASNEEHASTNGSNPQGGGASTKAGHVKPASTRPYSNPSHSDNHVSQLSQSRYDENGSTDGVVDVNDRHEGEMLTHQENIGEVQNKLRSNLNAQSEEGHEATGIKFEKRDAGELKDKYHGGTGTLGFKDGTLGKSPQDAIKKLDKDKLLKVKAAIQKQRKSRGDTKKPDFMDEDDLIERELEDGIEIIIESEKTKQERIRNLSNGPKDENAHHDDAAAEGVKEQLSHGEDSDIVEDGELEPFGSTDKGHPSPNSRSRKRKAVSPLDDEPAAASQSYSHHDFPEDRNGLGKHGYSDREHKRQMHENHV